MSVKSEHTLILFLSRKATTIPSTFRLKTTTDYRKSLQASGCLLKNLLLTVQKSSQYSVPLRQMEKMIKLE